MRISNCNLRLAPDIKPSAKYYIKQTKLSIITSQKEFTSLGFDLLEMNSINVTLLTKTTFFSNFYLLLSALATTTIDN